MPKLIWVFAGRTVTLLVLSSRGSNWLFWCYLLNWYGGISLKLYLELSTLRYCMCYHYHWWPLAPCTISCWPGAVAWSEASSLGMQAAPSSIPTSGTFFRGDLVMKTFLRPFSLFRWFKKSSCQLLAKECALSTGKLPRRLAQEQCG